jgi:homoserine kinase type II
VGSGRRGWCSAEAEPGWRLGAVRPAFYVPRRRNKALLRLELSAQEAAEILAEFGLAGRVRLAEPGKGTASPAVVVQVGEERIYLKARNPRYCAPEWMWYDAQVAWHLESAGLPVAPPLRAKDGRPWVERGGAVYQAARWRAGQRVDTPSLAQLCSVGRLLRQWHRATRHWRPSVRKPVGRLHDPKRAVAGLQEMVGQASRRQAEILRAALSWAECVEAALPDEAYWALPQVIVHGDVHPANLHFQGDAVSGLFDYDWVCPAPRACDLADAFIYLAGVRPQPLREGDIRSLTQPFELPAARVRAVLEGYGEPLLPAEQRALGWLLVARWLYARVDAAQRKIPAGERLPYLCAGLLRPLEEIRRAMAAVFGSSVLCEGELP